MFFGIDTQIMVDASVNLATEEYVVQKADGAEIAVSSVVFNESFGVLINKLGHSCDTAGEKLRTAIKMINGKQYDYNPVVLASEADRILKSHKDMKSKERDHEILAHYKYLGVKKIFCRDRLFQSVIVLEGLAYIHVLPTDKINEQKYLNQFKW